MKITILGPVNGRDLADLLYDEPNLEDGPRAPILSLLIRELLALGHTVEACTLSPRRGDAGTYIGDSFTLRIGPQRDRPRDRALDFFRAERGALLSMLDGTAPDIVHAHWTYEYALASLASGRPSLVTVHDWAPAVLAHHRHPYRVFRLLMQNQVLRRAPSLTANSPYIAAKIKRWYGREVPVVPNGLPFETSARSHIRQNPFVIGALNVDFGQRKNVVTLLRSFQAVHAKEQNTILRLGGNGYGNGDEAQRWAISHRLDQAVEFVGAMDHSQVPAFLSALDLFVHPSLEESFGMVLIESMREGTPVVGGRRSGAVPWVLEDGHAGELTDVRSADDLASTLLHLVRNDARRAQLAQVGFESARARFSISSVADQYLEQYRSAIDRHTG